MKLTKAIALFAAAALAAVSLAQFPGGPGGGRGGMRMMGGMGGMMPAPFLLARQDVRDDLKLTNEQLNKLDAMRDRINAVRDRIAAADPRLAFIGRQFGMFSMLPLTKGQVGQLRERHAIYMADSGRFNVVGMSDGAIDRFTAAVVEAL